MQAAPTSASSRSRQRAVVLLVACVLAVMAAWAWWQSQPRSGPAYAKAPTTFQWRAGEGALYRVSMRGEQQFDVSPAMKKASPDTPREAAIAMEGVLNLRVFETTDSDALLGAQFSPVEVRIGEQKAEREDMAYNTFFLIRCAKDGRFGDMIFPRSTSEACRAILERQLRAMAIVLPKTPTDAWQTVERDGEGWVDADYRFQDGWVEKQRSRYREEAKESALPIPVETKLGLSAVRALLDPDGLWLDAWQQREERVIALGDASATRLRMEASMERLPFEPDRSLAIWQEERKGRELLALFLASPKRTDDSGGSTPSVAGENPFAPLAAALKKGGDEGRTARSALLERMRRDPSTCRYAADLLLTLDETSHAGAEVALALRQAGSPEAQAALARILRNEEFDSENRLQAAVAMGDLSRPTQATREALLAQAHDHGSRPPGLNLLANSAMLSIGRMASAAGETNPFLAADIAETLKSELDDSPSPEQTAVILMSMGNADAAAFDSILEEQLSSENATVRKAAAEGGATSSSPALPEAWAGRLPLEPDAEVRAALADALATRRELSQAVLLAATAQLARDDDKNVRRRLADMLTRHAKASPDLRQALAVVFGKETDPEVKQALAAALSARQMKAAQPPASLAPMP